MEKLGPSPEMLQRRKMRTQVFLEINIYKNGGVPFLMTKRVTCAQSEHDELVQGRMVRRQKG